MLVRLSRFLIKASVFFSVGLACGLAALLLVISYGVTEIVSTTETGMKLKAATAPLGENLRELLSIGAQYKSDFEEFKNLQDTLAKKKMPPLCEVLCNESFFESEKHLEERTQYLVKFYRSWGTQALSDPHFRLGLQETVLLEKILTPTVLDTIVDLNTLSASASHDVFQKLGLSLKLQKAGLSEMLHLYKNPQTQADWKRLQVIKDLRTQCGRQMKSTIMSECQSALVKK